MFVSEDKKENNIAEYVLYMWQIEDVVRACQFKQESIAEFILDKQELSETDRAKLSDWYVDIAKKMQLQGIEKSGHLYEVNDVIMEIGALHNSLLTYYKDEKYGTVYAYAEKYLEEFKKVSNNPDASSIEVFFNALYGKLILKLQGKEISSSTEEAFTSFTNVLAYLSAKYKKMKLGEL